MSQPPFSKCVREIVEPMQGTLSSTNDGNSTMEVSGDEVQAKDSVLEGSGLIEGNALDLVRGHCRQLHFCRQWRSKAPPGKGRALSEPCLPFKEKLGEIRKGRCEWHLLWRPRAAAPPRRSERGRRQRTPNVPSAARLEQSSESKAASQQRSDTGRAKKGDGG